MGSSRKEGASQKKTDIKKEKFKKRGGERKEGREQSPAQKALTLPKKEDGRHKEAEKLYDPRLIPLSQGGIAKKGAEKQIEGK